MDTRGGVSREQHAPPQHTSPRSHACHFLSLPVLPGEAGHAGASPDCL